MGSDRFERAVAAIDAANSEDPHVEVFEGHEYPKELLYGQRMSAWLERLRPDAPEALRLACRAQHVRRWAIPRDTFPMDRRGYLIWRKQLYGFHADTVAAILREVGYDDETIDRVAALVRKRRLGADPDAQSLEDAACLVFLEHHFAGFAEKTDEEKIIGILRKTWGKMSAAARAHAGTLAYSEDARKLLERALAARDDSA
ncbi:MAG TPA: DUF4202 domain-containing protein [Candidatus Hydrogenedentes bacterium]|nr:DUF4202 domain-containing protein [Candidatus Hydrogenedentota bacterium]HNT87378.1 DUF4202 domain-containing protein [Candidatus Hydrogenedentota bacterium]